MKNIEYTRITFNLASSGLLASDSRSQVHIAVSSNAVSLFSTTVNCLEFSEITHNIARSKFESLLNDTGTLALDVAVSITTLDLPFERKTSDVGTQVLDKLTSEVGTQVMSNTFAAESTQVTLNNALVEIKPLSANLGNPRYALKKAKAAQELVKWEQKVDELAESGLKNQLDVNKFSSMAIHIKTKALQRRMLGILANGNLNCRQIFIDNNRLNLMNQWMKALDMVNSVESLSLSVDLMDTLRLLPIPSIAILLTTRIHDFVERWSCLRLEPTKKISEEMDAELRALKRKVQRVATELLEKWESLKGDQKVETPKKPQTMTGRKRLRQQKGFEFREARRNERLNEWREKVPVMGINTNQSHILEVMDNIDQIKTEVQEVAPKPEDSFLMEDSEEGIAKEETMHQNKKFKSF